MSGFWKLISLLISAAGFLVTGGLLYMRGETLLGSAIRATAVFIVLNIIQRYFGEILISVMKHENHKTDATGDSQG